MSTVIIELDADYACGLDLAFRSVLQHGAQAEAFAQWVGPVREQIASQVSLERMARAEERLFGVSPEEPL